MNDFNPAIRPQVSDHTPPLPGNPSNSIDTHKDEVIHEIAGVVLQSHEEAQPEKSTTFTASKIDIDDLSFLDEADAFDQKADTFEAIEQSHIDGYKEEVQKHDVGVEFNLEAVKSATKSLVEQKEGNLNITEGTQKEQVGLQKETIHVEKHTQAKADEKLINSYLSNMESTVKNGAVFVRLENGRYQIKAAQGVSVDELKESMDNRRFGFVIGTKVFVDRNSGIQGKVEIEDENGKVNTYTVVFLTEQQVEKMKLHVSAYYNLLIAQQGNQEDQDKKRELEAKKDRHEPVKRMKETPVKERVVNGQEVVEPVKERVPTPLNSKEEFRKSSIEKDKKASEAKDRIEDKIKADEVLKQTITKEEINKKEKQHQQ